MRKKWVRLIGVVVVLSLVLVYWQHSKTVKSSTSSLFFVEKKLADDQVLWIQGYNPQLEPREEIKIRMPDRKAWESVLEGKSYVMTYRQEGQEEPVFVEMLEGK